MLLLLLLAVDKLIGRLHWGNMRAAHIIRVRYPAEVVVSVVPVWLLEGVECFLCVDYLVAVDARVRVSL